MVQRYERRLAIAESELIQFCQDGLRALIRKDYSKEFLVGGDATRQKTYYFKDGGVYLMGSQYPGDTTPDARVKPSRVPFHRFNEFREGRTYEHEPSLKGVARRIEDALRDASLEHTLPFSIYI
ncbi:MAG: hypothetical protein HYT70_03540 [Candidatus Aenigmarchaeota archaeon]|nr:hypothetical protein [Candidatus Aenigmarchaeota archaeon]